MSVKSHIKRAAGALCSGRFFVPLMISRAQSCVNVIYYHFVGEPDPHYESFYTGCTLQRFASDLEELNRVFTFASLAHVIASNHKKGKSVTRPTVAITFDDGFDLCRTGISAVLARYGVSATTFVITSCIGNERLMWRHKLSAIKALAGETTCVAQYNIIARRLNWLRVKSADQLMAATKSWDMAAKDEYAAELWDRCNLPPESEYLKIYKPYFTWEGLREWIARGHSVGFHTHTHPYCSQLSEDALGTELTGPALDLKERLELKDLYLSYPFGDRLLAPLEDKLFAHRIFGAFFGICGVRRKGTSNQQLERIAVEQDGFSWASFCRPLLTV